MASFDLLRAFSGGEKLAFPPETRHLVSNAADSILNTLTGCPAEIFTAIGNTLAEGKKHRANEIETEEFEIFLAKTLAQLRGWDPRKGPYPDDDMEWALLGDAY